MCKKSFNVIGLVEIRTNHMGLRQYRLLKAAVSYKIFGLLQKSKLFVIPPPTSLMLFPLWINLLDRSSGKKLFCTATTIETDEGGGGGKNSIFSTLLECNTFVRDCRLNFKNFCPRKVGLSCELVTNLTAFSIFHFCTFQKFST